MFKSELLKGELSKDMGLSISLLHARYRETGTRVAHRDMGWDELTSRPGGYLNVVVIHREKDDRQK